MRRGQRGHAVNPAVHSSTEEGRNIRWGGIDFLLNAFTCDLCEKPHRSSAKAVAKEVNSFLRPPAGEKRLCICFAIAVVIMSSRVRCAVIHRCSRQLCIKLTGTVHALEIGQRKPHSSHSLPIPGRLVSCRSSCPSMGQPH